MRNLARRALGAVLAIAALGCGSGGGEGFLRAKGQGDRAHSAGRYREAAVAYQQAERQATRPRDKAEALYLAASAYARARAWDRAREVLTRLVTELPASDRAQRATFDLADIEIDTGDADRGFELLYGAMMKYPNNGLARRALERWVGRLEQRGGDALAWLRNTLPSLAPTELDETAHYLLASRLEATHDLQGARDAYVACAERHSYPRGGLFDDSLWHASLLDEELGRPQEAIAHLRRMLAVREESTMGGSYERPRFSSAQFRIAVLYRDKVGDRAAARLEFHRVYTDHKTSILRDDALWEEAKLARADGDDRAACALVATLAKDFRDSRYAPCTAELCPAVASGPPPNAPLGAPPTALPPPRVCHGYLLRPARDRAESLEGD